MNEIDCFSMKKDRHAADLTRSKLFLCVVLLQAILFIHPNNDDAQDIHKSPIHQATKQTTDTLVASFPQRSEDMDAATRAIFTSPSPQHPALGQMGRTLIHSATTSIMSEAEFLQLEFELSAIDKGTLSTTKLDQLLAEEDLPLLISEFEYQSRSDPDASALTGLFRQSVERALIASQTRARIEGFACGLRICVGLLSEGNEQDYWRWRDAFALGPELSDAGLRDVIVTPEGRSPMLRFAFSVEPQHIPFE
jgi:hypothetical protein